MTAKEVEKSFQEIWELFKETDRKFKETERLMDERSRETWEKIRAVSTAIDRLGDKWGYFVEGLVVPAVKRLFRERGIDIERIHHRSKAYRNGKEMEVDILAVNGDYAVLIEAKSTLGKDDVDDHIDRLKEFRTFFPEYADRQVIGAVAGIVIREGVDRYAYRKGLFVIAQSGDTVKILNDEKFEPKVRWWQLFITKWQKVLCGRS